MDNKLIMIRHILSDMDFDEALVTTKIYLVTSLLPDHFSLLGIEMPSVSV